MQDIKTEITQIYYDLFYKENKHLTYQPLLDFVLNDDKFLRWTGSGIPGVHHYGHGGLGQHTYEVMRLSQDLANNKLYKDKISLQQRQQLFWAALYHDFGKTYDYDLFLDNGAGGKVPASTIPTAPSHHKQWGKSVHARKFHHISRSSVIWWEQAGKANCPEEDKNEVLHAILAHHQLREWGSPVSPETTVAWLLHLSDNISARLDEIN